MKLSIAYLVSPEHTYVVGRLGVGTIYAIAIVITIVAVDVLFFRHHTVERLAANVGFALIFAAFYWRFKK